MPAPETASPQVAPSTPTVSPWALHRRLYDWVLSFAKTRWAMPALFVFSVCESVFFPIPSLALQIPMTLDNPKKAWRHAAVNLAGSLVGGAAGYAAGYFLWDVLVHCTFGRWLHLSDDALRPVKKIADDSWLLIGGALAIHPFKLFTLTGGALKVNFAGFMLACAIGRGVLFFGVGALLWKFGAPVRVFIDRWFNWLCLAAGLLIAAAVVAGKLA